MTPSFLTHVRRRLQPMTERVSRTRRGRITALAVLAVAAGSALSVTGVTDAGSTAAPDVQAAQVGQVRPAPAARPDAATSVVAIDPAGDHMVRAVAEDAHQATAARFAAAERKAEATQRAAEEAQKKADRRAAMWNRLADCESGDWDASSHPIPGTRRWDYGRTFSHGDRFEGGVNFDPPTWRGYKDPDMPTHAYDASRAQQIVVAERVLADQGWKAWPVCSVKLGYR